VSEPSDQGSTAPAREIDPAQAAFLEQRLRSEENLVLGVAAGLVASLVGAGAWAGITVATGYQIGFMAIGVGIAVGWAVRVAGKGVSGVFGAAGAALALLGCALGNLLAMTAVVARNEGVPLLDALPQLGPQLAWELLVASFSPMDVLFYGIALYEGYRLSFRRLGADELDGMLTGGGPL